MANPLRNGQGHHLCDLYRAGSAAGCGADSYHSKVDTEEGKAGRLARWRQAGAIIVATNALGLGLDIPDVRLPVHAGMRKRLPDYV